MQSNSRLLTKRNEMQRREVASIAELVEAMPGCSIRKCETILLAMDELCKDQSVASVALNHALTVPLLIQHMLLTSTVSTAMAVSVLWRLCQHSPDGTVMVEALQLGAFQKLLIIAQMAVPYADTKRRVCDLLKLFNHFRAAYECTDPNDFQFLRRSF